MTTAERRRSLTRSSEKMRTSGRPASPNSLNCVGGFHGIVMLPNVYRKPAHVFQRLIDSIIALTVFDHLRLPPSPVVLGRHIVNRTSMPEASVDEDCQLGPSEGDVRSAGKTSEMNAIPKTPPMQFAAQGKFRLGISSGHARELAAHGLTQGRRPVVRHAASLLLDGGS